MGPGDIYWINFAPRGGHAQAGRRPAVVIQNQNACDDLTTVLVVPLTSQQEAIKFKGTTVIHPDAENYLPRTSVALAFQATAIDKAFLSEHIGKVSENDLGRVMDALYEVLVKTTDE